MHQGTGSGIQNTQDRQGDCQEVDAHGQRDAELDGLDGSIGQPLQVGQLGNIIKFSICLSMCINLLAVLLSVMGVLNPTTGALVHNAGSCFVVLIAALLYDCKLD